MHIPDGFLAARVWVPLAAGSLAFIGTGLRKIKGLLDERDIPAIGMTSAFIFAAQMLNFPVGAGTSGHFMGGAFAAIVLGPWMATLVMSCVLIIQCLAFQDGGLLALGTNIFNMGVISVWCGYGIFRLLTGFKRAALNRRAAVFAASWSSIVASAIACSLELSFSGTIALPRVLPAMAAVHAVIGVGEGLITAAVVELVVKLRPDLLHGGIETNE